MTQPSDALFTPEDLAANRVGELTQDQRDKLTTQLKLYKNRIGMWLLWFAILICVGGGIEFANAGGSFDDFIRQQSIPMAIAVGVFIFLMVVSTVITWWSTRHLRAMKIHVVEGDIHAERKEGYHRFQGEMRWSELKIKRVLFRFADPAAIDQFQNGETYRVYYVPVPQLPVFLSAEKVKLR